MKKILLKTCLFFVALFGSFSQVNANSVHGNFFCEIVFHDGSSKNIHIATTEDGMVAKNIKYGDVSKFVEIHRGKNNDFKVFVLIENWVHEDIIVISASEDERVFHYNGTITPDRETAEKKVMRGNCTKL